MFVIFLWPLISFVKFVRCLYIEAVGFKCVDFYYYKFCFVAVNKFLKFLVSVHFAVRNYLGLYNSCNGAKIIFFRIHYRSRF